MVKCKADVLRELLTKQDALLTGYRHNNLRLDYQLEDTLNGVERAVTLLSSAKDTLPLNELRELIDVVVADLVELYDED